MVAAFVFVDVYPAFRAFAYLFVDGPAEKFGVFHVFAGLAFMLLLADEAELMAAFTDDIGLSFRAFYKFIAVGSGAPFEFGIEVDFDVFFEFQIFLVNFAIDQSFYVFVLEFDVANPVRTG